MTTVLTGGDSFTAHIMEDNIAWPNHINKAKDPWKECKVINVSEMASDNVLIARNVVKGLQKHQDDITHVIIGWSDPNRFSLYAASCGVHICISLFRYLCTKSISK